MAASHIAYSDMAIHKVSGTDPDQDAQSLIQLIEWKINFALRHAPGDAGELANNTFKKKALFPFLLRGLAIESYENNITNTTTWENVKTNFITGFSDVRNKVRYGMEVEHWIRGDGEEMRIFLQRIRRTVGKGWPNQKSINEALQQNAERDAQAQQRRQRYTDYLLKRLPPRYLKRRAQDYLMENPNATWNDFSTQINRRDISFQVSSNFLKDEEYT